MIKSILVCTDGSEYGDVACDYAIYLASKLEARLTGLHILDSRLLEGPMLADVSGWVGAEPYGVQLEQFRELMEKKQEAVVDALTSKCEQNKITPNITTKMGHPPRVILDEEASAELLVLGRKGEDADLLESMMGSTTERVTRRSVNPCLVTPSKFGPITNILAAYDGSAHASKALHEAIELSLALNCQLHILTVVDNIDMATANRAAAEGLALAKDHKKEANSLIIKGYTEQIILETADNYKCDLIVVGAYGHSRIRELVLGSTTTHILIKTDKPILLVR